MKTKLFSINWRDVVKGIVVAIITTILITTYEMISKGTFDFTKESVKFIVISGLGGGIAYVIKNFFTNSNGVLLKKEVKTTEVIEELKVKLN